mmetsp:Transcript_55972/g.98850  ORF Transcript_55972/g.98850 Transcript_55972/m.98850 type:complete len:105 (+) Transcript_55972:56-370(+)
MRYTGVCTRRCVCKHRPRRTTTLKCDMCVRLRDLADVGNVRRLGGSLHARVRYVPSVTSYVPLEPTVLAEEAVHLRAACARQDSRARGALTRARAGAPARRCAR